jgi:branched-chain amino acid transport system permease protein
MLLFIEQCLNGLQLGLLLFLLAAGLTLVFGIMDLVNLAHGSLYMIGAYFGATFTALTGDFITGILLALVATWLVGMAVEVIALRGSTDGTILIMCSVRSACSCFSMKRFGSSGGRPD